MSSNYQISVLGPIPFDHITTSKGQVITKYGCAAHPVIALARLLDKRGTVHPVAHLRQKDEAAVRAIFEELPNIQPSALYTEQNQGDVIQLRFLDQNKRVEQQTAFMPPISPEDVAPVIDSDLFVCVPISDYEVPLETLQYIKANRKPDALTIFDAHGPTTCVTVHGDRLRRFWVDRDRWLPYIDVLKMNIEEAGCCWFDTEYTTEELTAEKLEPTEKEMADFARHALQKGVKMICITLDERGCMVYEMEDGQFLQTFVPSVPVNEVIDTTGCGDSFAGGLAYGLLLDRTNYIRAAQYANVMGALRTQGTTFDVFKNLEDTQAIIREAYRENALP